jgi:hypothetical protein
MFLPSGEREGGRGEGAGEGDLSNISLLSFSTNIYFPIKDFPNLKMEVDKI